MTLNCKVGDLAVVVRSGLGNVGKIVRVLQPYHDGFRGKDGMGYRGMPDRPTWVVECESGLSTVLTSGATVKLKVRAFSDAGLRPIRDQPGEDETLMWAGLPQDAGVLV